MNGTKIKSIAEKYHMHPIVMGKYIKKWDLKKKVGERNPEVIKKSIDMSNKASLVYLKNQSLKTKRA